MENIKSDIDELKSLVKEKNLTKEEKNIIKKLLNYIRLNVKLSLFNHVLINKIEVDDLINTIDNLIDEYVSSIKDSSDKVLIGRVNNKIKRLQAIKSSLVENRFEYFVKDIINDFDDEQELIKMCNLSLSSDYQRFNTYFGKPIVSQDGKNIHGYKINEDTIDNIFALITNHPLNVNINAYVLAIKEAEKFDFKLKNLKRRRELFNKCIDNHELIEKFIKCVIDLKRVKEKYQDFEKTYTRNKNVIEVIESSSFFERLVKKYDKDKAVEENEIIYNNYLVVGRKKEEELENSINELFSLLSDLGISPVLVELQNRITVKDFNVSYNFDSKSVDNYEHVAHTLFNEFVMYNNKTISSKDEKCKREIDLVDDLYSLILEERQKHILKANKVYSNMDDVGKELIDNHLRDCIKVVELENSSRKFNVAPILSAYVLRIISQVKNIDFEVINEMFNEEDDMKELMEEYETVINRKIGEMYYEIDKIKKEKKTSIFDL